jgi:antitoxin component of MazEF toxin-antitoxin module
MWVRSLIKIGDSHAVVIPSDALEAVRWERGDTIRVVLQNDASILLTKINLAEVSDTARKAFETLPSITYA